MKHTKNYFAGANTGVGFCNCFEYINNPHKPGMLYIIKGGSGTGKSTLMKRVGAYFETACEIEYFYCSSDPVSLDGVRLKGYNIAIADGTAPHVTEAKMPGITEKIINVGQFIGPGVARYKKQIGICINKKALCFKAAYLQIEAAAKLYECNLELFKDALQEEEINKTVKALLPKILRLKKSANKPAKTSLPCKFPSKIEGCCDSSGVCDELNHGISKQQGGTGTARKMFLTAIGGTGTINLQPANNYQNVITLNQNPYAASKILQILSEQLNQKGCNTINFYNNLCPNILENLYVDELDLFITSSYTPARHCEKRSEEATQAPCNNKPKNSPLRRGAAASGGVVTKFIKNNLKQIEIIKKQAANTLELAKKEHKNIEKYYIKNMDFKGLDILTANLIKEIKQKIKK